MTWPMKATIFRAHALAFSALLIVGLASVAMEAQQANAPVSVDSPGVAPLELVTYVRPEYPQIAQAARVSGEVVLDVVVDVDGGPQDIRVMRSIPLLDQGAIDVVRRWRFKPPKVNGAPGPVRVPIAVVFAADGGSYSLPVNGVRSSSLPSDFAVTFTSNCDGQLDFNTATGVYERNLGVVRVRVQLGMEPATLESLYNVIVKGGLMADTTDRARWPDMPEGPQVSHTGIRVSVPLGRPGLDVWSDGVTPRQYLLEIRMNGIWTRLFPVSRMQGWPPTPRDKQLEPAVRQVDRFFEKYLQSFEVMRKLPRNQQWCRWPD